MFRVQVWNEDPKGYIDAHLLFDAFGVTGFKPASDSQPVTELGTGDEALRACEELGQAADVVCCVLDTATGKRHFDDFNLPN